jgi:two-component system CheB/CheR fusion protein
VVYDYARHRRLQKERRGNMHKTIRVTPKKEKIMPAGPQTTSFPVVGIGASAGGLEAFQELLKNLSDKPGMAFVFIMHLAPGHKSMLTELLARLTKMPVREIKNGMLLEINHVYIIPSSTNVSIANGRLKLSKMEDAGLKRMPIDWFFRSLAEEQGNRAIGVILSGTATDGTLGAEAIKAEGGIVFAQDEKSAKYDGMPRSAIAAGCVDFVLSPKKIARELERIAKHPLISSAGRVKADESIITEDKGIEGIFDILRSAKGLDFTHYKTPTISRRVSRRMVLLKLENLKSYIKFLRENKDEVEELYEDLLLNVTSFFRDPKVFDALKKQVLPAILKNKTKNQDVRIWVPGCSSGEEAYSIAICLLEVLGNKTRAVPVQIFSTDVRERSINEARRGIYGKNIKNSITPERLKRFFTKTGNSYKVSKQLRDMCIFSKQNVFSDPPFSNLDLVSCRNLIIYLQPVLQKRVFHNFHYGLRPGGFLLLGNSESIHGYSNLFKTLDGKQRISVKKYLSVGPELELGQKYYPSKKLDIKEETGIEKGKETDIESIVERIVLDEYAPCGVLIDSSMKVVQFRGHTGRFLESAAGKPSLDIFKLAREGLLMPLRAAIYKARETKHTVRRETEDFRYSGHRTRVNITVVPVKYGPLKEEFFLVLFDEITGAVGLKNLPKPRGKISLKGKSVKSDEYIDNLQKELAETKEYLQTVIEDQESANEEVKTANEEILSSNEELQSTNEELETAKEELQSSNEELITTNEELQNRNAEVSLLNNDLINLLSSINMPVVMMGTDLVIRRITPQAEKALNIVSSDVGRAISKIKLNVDIPDLEKILVDVIESLHPKTFEIKDREGNWYSVYIRPYRTLDNKIDGVVAIFVDTTERKKAQQIIDEARIYAENIVETIREPLIMLDTDLKVISANKSFYQTFKVNHKETQGRFIYDLGNRQWDIPKLRQLLEEILPKNNTFDDYEIEHHFETIGPKTMLFNARRHATTKMVLITIEDITERKRAEEELRRTYEELQAAHRRLKEFQVQLIQTEKMSALGTLVAGTAHELNNPIMGILNFVAHCVKHTSEDAPIYTALQDIQHEAKRCAEIVRNLLTFSHVERDDDEAYQKGSLTEILGRVLELLRYRIEKQRVSVTQHIADDTPEIWMNPNSAQRLILNLIANALDALEDSPIRELNVEIHSEGEFVQMTIADTGCGIAAEHLGSVFDPFFTTKPVGQGTGLGLSVCQGIVETHGGKITCESEPGVGAKFTILLPVEKAGKEQIKCASAYL